MNNEPRLILLDTHIWLWLASGTSKAISPKLKTLIEKLIPASSVKVSTISFWEIGMLALKNRITVTPNVKEWLYKALRDTGVSLEDITTEIAIESTLLQGEMHGDPADRILIATAKHLGATLITHDKEIISYSKKYNLSALTI